MKDTVRDILYYMLIKNKWNKDFVSLEIDAQNEKMSDSQRPSEIKDAICEKCP